MQAWQLICVFFFGYIQFNHGSDPSNAFCNITSESFVGSPEITYNNGTIYTSMTVAFSVSSCNSNSANTSNLIASNTTIANTTEANTILTSWNDSNAGFDCSKTYINDLGSNIHETVRFVAGLLSIVICCCFCIIYICCVPRDRDGTESWWDEKEYCNKEIAIERNNSDLLLLPVLGVIELIWIIFFLVNLELNYYWCDWLSWEDGPTGSRIVVFLNFIQMQAVLGMCVFYRMLDT